MIPALQGLHLLVVTHQSINPPPPEKLQALHILDTSNPTHHLPWALCESGKRKTWELGMIAASPEDRAQRPLCDECLRILEGRGC